MAKDPPSIQSHPLLQLIGLPHNSSRKRSRERQGEKGRRREDREKMAIAYTFYRGWFIKKIYYQLIKL